MPTARERWKNRLGGTVAVSSVLLMPVFLHLLDRDGPWWTLVLIVPAAFLIWLVLEWTLGGVFRSLERRLIAWSIRPGARNYIGLGRWQGVPVFLHWTYFAVPLAFLPSTVLWPAFGAALVGASSLVVLLHELGHVVAARRRSCRVHRVELHAMHGLTFYEPSSDGDAIVVAWGGVLAQLFVAVPACAWWWWGHAGDVAGVFLMTFGPWSLVLVAVNLLPLPGLDGATAWRFLRRKRATASGRRPPLEFRRR